MLPLTLVPPIPDTQRWGGTEVHHSGMGQHHSSRPHLQPPCCGVAANEPGLWSCFGLPGEQQCLGEGSWCWGDHISLSLCGPCLPFPFPQPRSSISMPCCGRGTPPMLFSKKTKRLVKLVNPLNSTAERGPKMKVWKGNTSSTRL